MLFFIIMGKYSYMYFYMHVYVCVCVHLSVYVCICEFVVVLLERIITKHYYPVFFFVTRILKLFKQFSFFRNFFLYREFQGTTPLHKSDKLTRQFSDIPRNKSFFFFLFVLSSLDIVRVDKSCNNINSEILFLKGCILVSFLFFLNSVEFAPVLRVILMVVSVIKALVLKVLLIMTCQEGMGGNGI